jgi:hypothetical protein
MTTAAKLSQAPTANDDDAQGRSCAQCGRPLPASARSWRKFCSSRCRVKSWDAANPGADQPGNIWLDVPLHWHHGERGVDGQFHDYPMLAGDGLTRPVAYWRGLGCPPTCPRMPEPPGFSIGIRPGQEGLSMEFPPEQAHLIGPDNWHTVADPADYGAAPRRPKRGGDVLRIADHRRRIDLNEFRRPVTGEP